jgi:hypothetical protein
VRELESVLKQAMVHATGPVIIPEFLPETVRLLQRFVERRRLPVP